MVYQELSPNGELVTVKEIKQEEMTSDCWMVQFKGLKACESCQYRNTEDCGGGNTLEKMKNT